MSAATEHKEIKHEGEDKGCPAGDLCEFGHAPVAVLVVALIAMIHDNRQETGAGGPSIWEVQPVGKEEACGVKEHERNELDGCELVLKVLTAQQGNDVWNDQKAKRVKEPFP